MSLILITLIALAQGYYIPAGINDTVSLNSTGDKLRIGFGSCYDENQKGAQKEVNIMRDIA